MSRHADATPLLLLAIRDENYAAATRAPAASRHVETMTDIINIMHELTFIEPRQTSRRRRHVAISTPSSR